ncbi:nickel pincer cofactor biosynthesis protein LarB [Thermodesulfobacteriota bacterium]
MNQDNLKDILTKLSKGEATVEETLGKLRTLPFEDMEFACIDHHRGLRRGVSEIIYGEGKEADQILSIMERMSDQNEDILVTRLSNSKAEKISKKFPECKYHKKSGALTLTRNEKKILGKGRIQVICAGTSDIPVAEESAVTAMFLGNEVDTIYDVGVSGLHRILYHREKIMSATVLIVVAGMEGALPSVVGGLVDKPVIAVPTSVGYGSSFQGLTALLGMLNSCAAGVTVVNIDNGFGAGYAASIINRV